ncbi:MAG: hypothetical protein MUO72_09625 [Bacteroidales bacterium]|nr:hypothetical protein [Bacteroidales bacterium]
MSNSYPSRKNLITGKVQKSLCANCANNLKIRYIKTSAFWKDDIMDASKDIKKEKVFHHHQKCIYLNFSNHDMERIRVIKCNQFKNKDMKKIKRDPSGYGNNAVCTITGRPNAELNRDGGNGCSNPHWGTGEHGDSNPDTQKELTAIQKYENNLTKVN